MSYTIEFNNGLTETWYTCPSGTPINNTHEKLSRMREGRMVKDVLSLTAEGSSLQFVKYLYANTSALMSGQRMEVFSIPIPKDKTSVTWYGSIARTIIANL